MRISRPEVLTLVERRLPPSRELGWQVADQRIDLPMAHRETLVRWVRAGTTAQRVVTRSVVILLAAAGWSNARVAGELGVSRRTVALWKSRFAARGPSGLLVDRPGRGRKRGRDAASVARILAMSGEQPASGTRWTVRALARVAGVSHATVQRVWREHDISPRGLRPQFQTHRRARWDGESGDGLAREPLAEPVIHADAPTVVAAVPHEG